MNFDTIIAMAIVIGAAFYLYRKFTKTNEQGGGCASGGECCGSRDHANHKHCCSTKR